MGELAAREAHRKKLRRMADGLEQGRKQDYLVIAIAGALRQDLIRRRDRLHVADIALVADAILYEVKEREDFRAPIFCRE